MLKLGLIQLKIQEGKILENKKHIEELIAKYSKLDVDLLCFPELSVSGYDFEMVISSLDEKQFFEELAKKYRIGILAGVHIKEEGKHYDAVCLWDEMGYCLETFKKMHLWENETRFFTAGDELKIFQYKNWKIGILICADVRIYEASTPLKNMGAEVIIAPSAWAAGWESLFHLCGRMRAAENQIYTVLLNRATGDMTYCGETALIGPDGEILKKIDGDEEDCLFVTLEKSIIKEARNRLVCDALKRPAVYKKYDQYRFSNESKGR